MVDTESLYATPYCTGDHIDALTTGNVRQNPAPIEPPALVMSDMVSSLILRGFGGAR